MPAKMNNQETMEVASERLQLNVNDSPLGPARIELIASTLVERAQETAQPGVFLSHYQVYGPDVMSLKLELEDTVPELRDKIWYDKDNGKSKAQVVGAVASSVTQMDCMRCLQILRSTACVQVSEITSTSSCI